MSRSEVTARAGLVATRYPIPVGAELRGADQLTDADEVNGGLQATQTITVELKDALKLALVAEPVYRHLA